MYHVENAVLDRPQNEAELEMTLNSKSISRSTPKCSHSENQDNLKSSPEIVRWCMDAYMKTEMIM